MGLGVIGQVTLGLGLIRGVRSVRWAGLGGHEVGQVGLGVGACPLIGGRYSVGVCLSGPKQLGADPFGKPRRREAKATGLSQFGARNWSVGTSRRG